jgi:hypothetical protein
MAADLDIQQILMFDQTSKQHRTQAGQLQTAASEMGQPSPVTAGPFIGREQMATALNEAHITAGNNMATAADGVGAYSNALESIYTQTSATHQLTTELLGSVLNTADRADQATPGGI